MNRGDAVGRASGRSSLLGHPNAKFFAANGRESRKRTGTCNCNRAAQVVIRVSVAAREMWASQPENVLDMFCQHTLRQQLPGDPQINDAPIGLSKSFTDAPSLHPALVNLLGLCGIHAEWGSLGSRCGAFGQVARDSTVTPPLCTCWPWHDHDRLQQGLGTSSQTSTCLHDFYPRSITIRCAPLRLLIGEPSQSSQVTPIGAGRVSPVDTGQMFSDRGSHSGLQWQRADMNPCLQMTRAGLQHYTGLMAIGPHRLQNRWCSLIQIEQNVTGVMVFCIGPEVDITTLAIANAQKPDRGGLQQLASSPKSFSRKRPSGGVVNQTDQKQIVRHSRELTSDRSAGNPQSAIDARCWFGTWLTGKGALYRETLQATGRTTRVLNRPKRACSDSRHANSENQLASSSQKERSFFSKRMCDIFAVSHEWGSPQYLRISCLFFRRFRAVPWQQRWQD
jgi:hypothetical protein